MTKFFQARRHGFSLLEVLVSVFVVLIGLLGVATMIPAGRYEILQARKADMGANLSRAVVNSVVTQISNGWNPGNKDYYVVAGDNGELARRLTTGLSRAVTNKCPQTVYDNRTFNGDDDISIIEGDDNRMQISLENNEAIGTGFYTACATIVYLGNGYYEITGLAVYRFEEGGDISNYQRGSYLFCADSAGKKHWYKIDNLYTARGTTFSTAAGEVKSGVYLGDVVGICKKVVRIDGSYTVN
ncbi:MAG: prepilin-type N-terminal cleavage/methylation domain-containing protein [Thermoguttaceae bacterium]|nr:prepilin-type N-terminal cleavage/methylation domain-containing protein [Thermoguttaceae bacterium]